MNNKKSDERSAMPIQGLSKRAQQLLQPRRFHFYGKAQPSQAKEGATA